MEGEGPGQRKEAKEEGKGGAEDARAVRLLTPRERDWLPAEPPPARGGTGEGPGGPKGRRARSELEPSQLLGKKVVDADDLELGYVDEVGKTDITVGEGPFSDWLKIKKNYIGEVGELVRLLEPLQELLEDVEVFDRKGQSLGWVSDVVATAEVVDGLVVKSPSMSLFVLLEDIRTIGGTITLDITLEELRKQAANRRRSR